jgi:hypothetical protein
MVSSTPLGKDDKGGLECGDNSGAAAGACTSDLRRMKLRIRQNHAPGITDQTPSALDPRRSGIQFHDGY